ncbi:MAG: RagB/SusD family nutrient uptake outer membrane protein [Prevotella sp.]|nr:RagB/SusD family nutrient uptake outer membrane protein [Prevotella sp.]
MKSTIKLFGTLAAGLLLATSCSEDYLEQTPNDAISMQTAFGTTENCALAVNGIARMMTSQYLSTQGMNGEGTMKNWYNNFNGNDTQKCNQTGWASLWNNLATYKTSKTSSYAYYPWYYYYKLIGNANQVIDRVDEAAGTDADKKFIKAQALTYRAYSYYNLVTMYSKRWQDSNNGASDGVVLRLKATDAGEAQEKALSTLKETYDQIYADLDDAIKLFQESGVKSSSVDFYLPTLEAAYAIKARAALYREDWAVAAECAANARTGHDLMGAKEYAAGFNAPNNEWIWGVYEAEDQTLYYYSYFAYIGSNSSASACRSYPVAISKELIEQIPATDVRRNLFLVPQTDTEFKEMNATTGRTTKGTMYTRGLNSGYVYSTSYIFGYMQFKLRAEFMPGGGSFNLVRAAEMYYTEAEALCHIAGKDNDVKKLLEKAVKPYDSDYTCNKTGADLLEEVKLYRRFDLWGEGFDWTDCKRWKKDINRKPLEVSKGLASAGNFHSTFAIKIAAGDDTRWIWAIPNKECDYNDLIKEND